LFDEVIFQFHSWNSRWSGAGFGVMSLRRSDLSDCRWSKV